MSSVTSDSFHESYEKSEWVVVVVVVVVGTLERAAVSIQSGGGDSWI